MQDKHVYIFNIPFLSATKSELLDLITSRVENKDKTYIVTANAEIAIHAKDNKDYFDTIKKATYIVPDGIGVVKGARMLNQEIPERVPGIELMIDLLKIANNNKQSVYFYGAKPEIIESMVSNVKRDYPNLNVVGYNHGYDNDEDNKITKEVVSLKPDYVFVAKGAPLQDKWIEKVLPQVDKGVFMGVGGSFDVIAGVVERAPEIWRKLNLEWFYRVAGDPKRWKRSLALPKFVVEVIKEKVTKK